MKRGSWRVGAWAAAALVWAAVPIVAAHAQGGIPREGPSATGDIFVARGDGNVEWRDPGGGLRGVLPTGATGQTTGMAIGLDGTLFVTDFDAGAIHHLDRIGTRLADFGSGYDSAPESILFDAAGNAYVGQATGAADILKFDPTGKPLAAFDAATEQRGTDWIELAADQCTMLYTSEGKTVFRYDVCKGQQLPVFATNLPGQFAYALRILPQGGLLVADNEGIVRLDGSGRVVQAYDTPSEDEWFALNLDPDGTSFWSAGLTNTTVVKFDIESGAVVSTFTAGIPVPSVGGLAIVGELTAARSSGWVASVANPGEVSWGIGHTLTNLLIAALVVLLIPFPATLFNATLEEHYDEVSGWFRGVRGATDRLKTRMRGNRAVAFLAIVATTALVYSFLDPTFGFKKASLALFLGLAAGLAVVTVAFALPRLVSRGDRSRTEFRAFPGSLPIAAVCVLISRIAAFQPGYVYGTIAGFHTEDPDKAREGRQAARTGVVVLLLALAAWFVRTPVHRSAVNGGSLGVLILDAVLAATFVAGLETLAFGMMPLRFLLGDKVRRWNLWVWVALFGLGVFGFVHVLLDPAAGYLSHSSAIVSLLLFLGFGAFSVAFWWFFRLRDQARAKAAAAGQVAVSPAEAPVAVGPAEALAAEIQDEQAPSVTEAEEDASPREPEPSSAAETLTIPPPSPPPTETLPVPGIAAPPPPPGPAPSTPAPPPPPRPEGEGEG